MKFVSNNIIQIPTINRDGKLITRLLVIVLGGFDGALDKESQLFLRLLCRLVDKSYDEYMLAREYIKEEMKAEDKLAYRFSIINHLEDCLNAINRAINIFNILISGKTIGKHEIKTIIKKDCSILKLISSETIAKIKKYKVSQIRNRIEHIEEDIYLNKFKNGLFLDVDDEYKKVCINNKCLSLFDLALAIENYHNFVLEIIKNLPNRIEGGVYYYDKK